jgi:hypothetical protein
VPNEAADHNRTGIETAGRGQDLVPSLEVVRVSAEIETEVVIGTEIGIVIVLGNGNVKLRVENRQRRSGKKKKWKRRRKNVKKLTEKLAIKRPHTR